VTLARPPVLGLDVETHTGAFGEEFTALDAAIRGRQTTRSRRAAEDMTWRYRLDPLETWSVVTARRAGSLVAFAAYTRRGQDVHVADVFGHLTLDVVRALFDAVADGAAAARAQTLQTVVGDADELAGLLPGARFRARDDGPRVVAYDGASTPARRGAWSLRSADLTA